ncbi:uncharacterized protein [Pleurodeles waltl]|uniref:uncharacterized protein n=1 Tax=Pleurodeles waltl TaxID=8319 RepID=UPI0037093F15
MIAGPSQVSSQDITLNNRKSPNNIEVNWSAPPGLVEWYTVYLQGAVTQNKTTSSIKPVNFTDLLPGREYSITITTISGPFNETSAVVTEATYPERPGSVTSLNAERNSIKLSWDHPLNMSGIQLTYNITYSSSQGNRSITNSSAYANIENLVSGTNYTISVVTVGVHNYSSPPLLISSYTRPSQVSSQDITLNNRKSPNNIEVNWSAPPGLVEWYTVYLQGAVTQNKTTSSIKPVNFTDLLPGREYSITITTISGPFNETSAVVTEATYPERPGSVTSLNAERNSIKISWDHPLNMSGIQLTYNITYSSSQGNGSITNNSAYASIENLVSGTNYTISVVTVGVHNYSSPPLLISSYTRPSQLSSQDITLNNRKSPNNIEVNWSAPPGLVEWYTVYLQGAVTQNKTTSSIKPVNFTDLLPGREYSITITTISGPFNETSAVVTEATWPSQVSSQDITLNNRKSPNNIEVNWSAPPGLVEWYNVYLQGAVSQNKTTSSIKPVNFTDLLPGREYSITITTISGPFNETSAVVTEATWPSQVSSQDITLNNRKSPNNIEVNWSAPPGLVEWYNVYLQGAVSQNKTTSSIKPVNFTDLLPGREYSITITTISGPFNETSAVVTEATYPERPGSVTSLDAERNSIKFSWNQPLNMNGIQLTYNITYNSSQGNRSITNTSTYANIENLVSGTIYTISVVTVGVYNYSSPPLLISSYTRPSQVSSQDITLNNRKSPNNIEVNWSAPPGLVEWYNVYLQGAVSQNKTTSSIKPVNFTDLLPGREYSITITTISGPFNETSAVVTEATWPSQVSSQDITLNNRKSPNNIEVNWSAPPGLVEWYNVYLQGAVSQNKKTSSIKPVNFTDLLPGREYSITITTISGPFNETSAVVTEATWPSQVSSQDITLNNRKSPNNIEVNWSAPPGLVEWYNVYLQGAVSQNKTTSSIKPVNFTDLLPGREYSITITTISGPFNEISAVVTEATWPSQVSSQDITLNNRKSPNNIEVNWSAPPGLVEWYNVYLQGAVSQNKTTSSIKPVNFTDLLPGREYSITITTISGPFNETSAVVTEATWPSQVSSQDITFNNRKSPNNIEVNWSAPPGLVEWYNVYLQGAVSQNKTTSSIKPVNFTDLLPGREYSITITTISGPFNETSAVVTEATYPERPGSVTSLDAERNSIKFSWNQPLNMSGIQLTYNITYNSSQGNRSITNTSTYANIENLVSGTNYTISVVTVGVYNYSSPPLLISSYTRPSQVSSQDITLNNRKSPNNIEVNWSAPPGLVEWYNVYLQGAVSQNKTTSSIKPVNFTDLLPGREYSITITTISGPFNETSAVVTEATWPSQVSSQDITLNNRKSPNNIEVNWSAPPGLVEWYNVYLQGAVSQNKTTSSIKPVNFTDLLPGREYSITITTISGPFNETSAVVTEATWPSQVSSQDITLNNRKSPNNIEVNWSAPPGLVEWYNVYLQGAVSQNKKTSSIKPVNFTDLLPGREYSITITTISGPFNETSAVVTEATYPERPGSVTSLDAERNSIKFSWNQPLNMSGIQLTYNITYNSSQGNRSITNTSTYANIENLVSGTNYTISVVTVGVYNYSSPPLLISSYTRPSQVSSQDITLNNRKSPNNIEVNWSAPPGLVEWYNVYLQGAVSQNKTTSSIKPVNFTDLLPGREYSITITTISGPFNETSAVVTEATWPSQVSSQDITFNNRKSPNNIEVNWSAPPGLVEWYNVYLQGAVSQNKTTSSIKPVNFTDLLPGREYSITITTISGPFNETSAVVTEATYPERPGSVTSLDAERNSIKFSWNQPLNMSGIQLTYNITYNSSQGNRSITNTSTYANIENLVSGTNYTISVVTVGVYNYSSPPLLISSYTRPSQVSSQDITLNNRKSPNNIEVNWSAPPGLVEWYNVYLQGAVSQNKTTSSIKPVNFTDLLPGREYSITITTISGPFNETSAVVTEATWPSQVSSQDITLNNRKSPNNIEVNWSAPPGLVEWYNVYLQGAVSQNKTTSSIKPVNFTDLLPGREYSITITTISGPFNETSAVVTEATYPERPGSVTSLDAERNSIKFSWNQPLNMSGIQLTYNITYSSSQGNRSITNTSTYANIENLVSGTNYTISVVTVGVYNYSSPPLLISSYTRPSQVSSQDITLNNRKSPNNIEVNWSAPPGLVEWYNVYLQGAVSQNKKTSSIKPVNFTDLLPGREYSITITTISGPFNETSAVVTEATYPERPGSVTSLDAERNSIKFSWNQPLNMSGIQLTYNITYNSSQGNRSITNTSTYANIENLVSGTNYTISVVTVGVYNYSSPPLLISSYTRPSQVSSQDITLNNRKSPNNIEVNWSAPPGLVEWYNVYLQGAVSQNKTTSSIKPVNFTDLLPGREYSITITTISGPFNETSAVVTEATYPERPGSVTSLDAERNSIKFSWNQPLNMSGIQLTYNITYSSSQGNRSITNTSTYANIENLVSGTNYTISVVTVGVYNYSSPPLLISSYTRPSQVSSQDITLNNRKSPNNIEVNWSAPPGLVEWYNVYLQGAVSQNKTTSSIKPVNFTDLLPGREYSITITTISGPFNETSAVVTEATYPERPGSVTSLNAERNSIKFSWNQPLNMSGIQLTYNITYSSSQGNRSITNTSTYANIENLVSGTNYTISVVTVGVYNYSSPPLLISSYTRPSQVSSQDITLNNRKSPNNIEVNWSAPPGLVEWYNVYLQGAVSQNKTTSSIKPVNFTDLLPGREYSITITTISGPFNETSAVVTEATYPERPGSVTSLDAERNSIKFSWNQPLNMSGIQLTYNITYSSSQGNRSITNTSTYANIENLVSGTNYTISVVTVGVYNYSSPPLLISSYTRPSQVSSQDITLNNRKSPNNIEVNWSAPPGLVEWYNVYLQGAVSQNKTTSSIKPVNFTDLLPGREYSITITTISGPFNETSAVVTEATYPERPGSVTSLNAERNSIKFSWNQPLNMSGIQLTYNITYSSSQGNRSITNTSTYANIENLVSGTNYTISVVTVGVYNYSSPPLLISSYTRPSQVSSQDITLNNRKSPNNIEVNWSAPPGLVEWYNVYLQGAVSQNKTTSSIKPVNFTDLLPGREYSITITTISGPFNETSAVVTEATYPERPGSVTSLDAERNSIKFSWNQPLNMSGIQLTYNITYNSSQGNRSITNTSTYANIENLVSGTNYTISVVTVGVYNYSSPPLLISSYTRPSQVSSQDITLNNRKSPNNIEVNWSAPPGLVEWYNVYLQGAVSQNKTTSSIKPVNFTDLLPGREYSITITTISGPFNETSAVVTEATYPERPGSVTSLNAERNSIKFSWNQPLNMSGIQLTYNITYSSSQGNRSITNTSTYANIENLVSGTNYTISVVTVGVYNYSSPPLLISSYTRPSQVSSQDITLNNRKSPNNIEVNWSAPPGLVEWYTVYLQGAVIQNETTSSIKPVNFTDLLPGREYSITITTISGPFNETSAVVTEATYPERPGSVTSLDAERNSIKFSWNQPLNMSGIQLTYNIKYSSSQGNGSITNTSTHANIENLVSGTNYTISVVTVGVYNYSSPPLLISSYTRPSQVSSQDITLNNRKSPNNIEVNWSAPPGLVEWYTVYLQGAVTQNETTSSIKPVNFTDLLPGREYSITITTISGPFNETSAVVTEATYPERPGSVTSLDAERNSIKFSWNQPLNMSGIQLTYNITYNSSQGNRSITNTSTYANIENLVSGTNYTISVVTVGVYNYSSPPLLISSYTRPSQVSSQDITLNNRKSPNNIEVNWSAPPGLVEWYNVYLQGAVSQNKTTSSIKPVNFTDLLPGREYSITITTISGPFNETSAVVTEATYPERPGSVTSLNAERNSIKFSWNQPLNMSGIQLTYNITYSSSQGNRSITNTSTYANIENLVSGTNYTISVVTVGVYNYSSPPLLISSYTRPSQVSSQDITLNNRKSPNNIEVNWSAPPGLVEWYNVYLQGAVSQNKKTSSIKPVNFTDLLPGREYCITITTISGPFNETSAVVTEATYPERPGSVTSLNAERNSIKFSWNQPLNMSGIQLTYNITYSSSQGNRSITNTSTYANIENLVSGTNYTISVVTVGVYNYSSPPLLISSYTRPSQVSSQDITLNNRKSPNNIEVNWSAPPGLVEWYTVYLQGAVIQNETTSSIKPVNFTDLLPGREYSITITTISGPFNETSAVVTEATYPERPGSVTSLDAERNSIKFSWNQPLNMSGIQLTYNIKYSSSQGNGSITNTSTHANIENLVSGTNYTISVVTVGVYNYSSPPLLISSYTRPSQVSSQDITLNNRKSPNNIEVNWSAPPGLVEWYTVYLQGAVTQNETTSSIKPVNFTDLLPGREYSITITTISGPFNETSAVVTEATYPERPGSVTSLDAERNSIKFSWNQPLNMSGIQLTYNITYSSSQGNGSITNTSTHANIENLVSGTNYTISVVTVGVYNYSSPPLLISSYTKNPFRDGFSLWSGDVVVLHSFGWRLLRCLKSLKIQLLLFCAFTGPSQVSSQDITLNNRKSPNNIEVNWSAPPGLVEWYTVYLQGAVTQNETTSSIKPVNFTDLLPGREYSITITTISGPFNETSAVVTEATYPERPGSVTSLDAERNSIKFSWNQPLNMSGIQLTYNITYSSSQGNGSITNTSTHANIENLVSGTNYTISVVTVGVYNYSSPPLLISSYTNKDNIAVGCKEGRITRGKLPNVQRSHNIGLLLRCLKSLKIQLLLFCAFTGPSQVSSQDITLNNRKSPNNIEVNWSAPPGLVEWYTVSLQGAVTQNETTSSIKPVNFTDLLPGREYSITITTISGPFIETSAVVTEATYPARPGSVTSLNAERNSIKLSWDQPLNMSGLQLTYNITYSSSQVTRSITNTSTYANIENLDSGTNYTISVVTVGAHNYASPHLLLSSYTRPSQVSAQDITLNNRKSTNSIEVNWIAPPGLVEWYTVSLQGAVTQTKTISSVQPITFTDLLPGREYNITITTISGPFNETSSVVTEATYPEPPTNAQFYITSLSDTQLQVQFSAFPDTNGPIMAYAVLVTKGSQEPASLAEYLGKTYDDNKKNLSTTYVSCIRDSLQSRSFSTRASPIKMVIGDGTTSYSYFNGPLNKETAYRISVAGFTRIKFNTNPDTIDGNKSLMSFISNGSPVTILPATTTNSDTGAIVGAVVGSIAGVTVLGIVGAVLWKRRRNGEKNRHEFDGPQIRSLKRSKGAPLENFEDFVRKQRADTNLGFEEDYEKLQSVGVRQTKHAAELPENKQKNRYNNVLPYDVSRVMLSCVNPTDDYINANYVPGYHSQKEFIAAQGPLPHTVPDFWRMIWEKQIYAIIMLTKCIELGKVKCDHYWPKVTREAMTFEDLRVILTAEFVLPDWTVRHLLVINNKTKEERSVQQFHFTAWPDHGVPVTTDVLINFRHLVRDYMKEECPVNSPALVHCSAGVGRTGTFIALDHIIFQMEIEKTIDIYSIVHNLRMHRALMVQTGAQYIFLHQCAVDMINAQKQAADSLVYENQYPTSIYEVMPSRSTSRPMPPSRPAYR